MSEIRYTYDELQNLYNQQKEKINRLEEEVYLLKNIQEKEYLDFDQLVFHPVIRKFLDILPFIFFQIKGNGDFVFVNKYALQVFGYTTEDFNKGLNISDLFYDKNDIHKFKKRFHEDLKNTNLQGRYYKMVKKNGSVFHGLVYATSWLSDKGIPAVYGVLIDHTEHYEMQEQLKKANHSKDLLFSIIAHDLKNPFNAISGFSELILSGFDTYSKEKILKLVEIIYQSSEKAYNLLENLLEWSKLHSGLMVTQYDKISLKDLIKETLFLYQEKAKSKHIKLSHICEGDIAVKADKDMISTVLRNLIFNALKFTDEEGSVQVFSKISEKNPRYAVISVKDTGVGIKPEKLPNLFSTGKIISTEGTHLEKGTGLGLILCKDFVEKNKGEIWVESEPGKGSTFYFTLPIADNN